MDKEDQSTPLDRNQLLLYLMNNLAEHYWNPLHKYLLENENLIQEFPAFLLKHEQIVIYIGKTHLAIEYMGPETTVELPELGSVSVMNYDYTTSDDNLFETIIGFNYSDNPLGNVTMPLPIYSDDWVLPTNKGMKKLLELKWDFMGQNSIIGINSFGFHVPEGEFCRLVNGRFFDADEKGLKTRHIKWIDFLPLEIISEDENSQSMKITIEPLIQLIEHDANYKYPLPPRQDYKFGKLPQINRFIELAGTKETSEPTLTSFLEKEENKFILLMGFLATAIHPQKICKWQSEDKDAIQPDFFVVRSNGYADIVEFKLPNAKNRTTVGRNNRGSFSAEINSYIAQTRIYKEYFEDPNNRKWVEETYGFKVRNPKRIVVVGRRWEFSSATWKEIIDDYKDVEIMTYDDLIDGVVAQFYIE